MDTSVRGDNEYEDLLAEWSGLESGLGIILGHPHASQEFIPRVIQYDRWMQGLLQRDTDAGLYLLFQLAGNSPVGYSASHALVCAVLCHLVALEWQLPLTERDSLVRAALTMNVSMTALQDELANQAERPTLAQQDLIRSHPLRSATLLTRMGVQDGDWVRIVANHHDAQLDAPPAQDAPAPVRLTRVLKWVDRYAAMISPRVSRAGRTAPESARAMQTDHALPADAIGQALLRVVGLYPPGTFVRMDSEELGVVLRRTENTELPLVALVGAADGQLLRLPRRHATAQGAPRIRAALAASAVRAQLHHYRILLLGSGA